MADSPSRLRRSQAAALEQPVQAAIEALRFALEQIKSAEQAERHLVADLLPAWEKLVSGESPPDPTEPAASVDDWPAVLFQIRGGWRKVIVPLADRLNSAGLRAEATAIGSEAFPAVERAYSAGDIAAIRQAEKDRILRLLTVLRPLASDLQQVMNAPSRDTQHPWGSEEPETPVSPANLAARLGIPESEKKVRDLLRKRLELWRRSHLDGGWVEVSNPKPREPKYLYPIGAVWALIQTAKAIPANSSELPAKKFPPF